MYRPFDKPLAELLKSDRLKIRYPKGYRRWRKKFRFVLKETGGNVLKALEQINERPLVSHEKKQSSTTPTQSEPGALRA